jgi:hypothetical protein
MSVADSLEATDGQSALTWLGLPDITRNQPGATKLTRPPNACKCYVPHYSYLYRDRGPSAAIPIEFVAAATRCATTHPSPVAAFSVLVLY